MKGSDSIILSGIRSGVLPTRLTRDVFASLVGFLQEVALDSSKVPGVSEEDKANAREFLSLILKIYRDVESRSTTQSGVTDSGPSPLSGQGRAGAAPAPFSKRKGRKA